MGVIGILAVIFLKGLTVVTVDTADVTTVSEYFSQNGLGLSFYSWYGSVRLFYFRVPEDTVLASFGLYAVKKSGSSCRTINITVHFQSGAPPVINPLGTKFASYTPVVPSHNLTIPVSTTMNNTFLNITNPSAGDWFIAAHLPEDDGKIEVEGLSSKCSYVLQPLLMVSRRIVVPVLEAGTAQTHSVSSPNTVAYLKIFIPEYTQELNLTLWNCSIGSSGPSMCSLQVSLGSTTVPVNSQAFRNCTGKTVCTIVLKSPPWEKWLRITVASTASDNVTVGFNIGASLSACKLESTSSVLGILKSFGPNSSYFSIATENQGSSSNTWNISRSLSDTLQIVGNCFRHQTVLREDLDVLSAKFSIVNGPNVTVAANQPTVLLFNLNSGDDSGGTVIVDLLLNKSSWTNHSALLLACFTYGSPILSLESLKDCSTGLSQGYSLKMNSTKTEDHLRVPFPVSGYWYLTMQILCFGNQSDCDDSEASVLTSVYLTPCIDDCGQYGQCRLLRTFSYLYAACVCKAGWQGWSCTDDATAQSYGRQLLATLLLTLSNFMFIPAIVVAIYRYYIIEASVYAFAMFFSTFYHACDQPGIAVMCIMDYDTLQFCDFLGSVVAIWVTILCMARIKEIFKYLMFVIGSLFIAMSLQLGRRGVWNMMGPCLFALIIMAIAWVYRGVKRRKCYPPWWKRWVFFIFPGIGIAFIAICIYAFAETENNYYVTHSIWHILVSLSVAFLLPPRELLADKPWSCLQKSKCRYQICSNQSEDTYDVT
ncbi:post-GPI attachment to proteins factor 6 [Protopterus annectens]|uniref:post-GPI attachment to proteins factor 6 n=1 Tax=Protopterus annectens TaxID=7888 RepID=UPI001CFADBC8|nr:post-GPI attachment to proteins factor 6 [Protopterus annectens]